MDPPAVDPAYPPAMEPVVIRSQGAKLSGIVYVAQGPGPHPAVILLHGYPGNEKNLDLAHVIRRAGWNVLFFHYRGSWGSEGRFSIEHAIADTHAVVAFMRSAEFIRKYRTDPARLAVIGHSMGGYVSFEVLAGDPRLRCGASLAGANLGKFGELAQQSAEFASQLAYYIDDANAIVGNVAKPQSRAGWRTRPITICAGSFPSWQLNPYYSSGPKATPSFLSINIMNPWSRRYAKPATEILR